LAIVAVALPGTHQVVIEAETRVGSRYEAPEDNGLSHFLEHVPYRGDPGLPDGVRARAGDRGSGGRADGRDLGPITAR
jgi:predicted Zn-dependent peptidase